MNPYQVLGIADDSNKEQIRKAYLKLVLKYHPDKCTDSGSQEKFKEIYTAYELLKNDEYKNKYDSLECDNKYEYYNEFKNIFSKKYPGLSKIIENIIQVFYKDENEFKNDFNNFDFTKIYETITNKIPDIIENIEAPNKITPGKNSNNLCSQMELNIYGTIHSTLKNRYMNKYEKISVNRITKDPKILFIPLRENKIIFDREGELYKNNNGDIIINIVIQKDDRFTCINNDLFTEQEITLYEYLYGGQINFEHIDGEIIIIEFSGLVKNISILTINNKGLIYYDNNEQKRGKLIIEFKIKNMEDENFKEIIKNI